jgi:hypothetical protein
MKRFKVELTEEQYNCLCMFLGYEWSNTSDKTELEVKDAVFGAERIQEKVWLPFTTLKDGGTYLTKGGKEYTVALGTVPYADKVTYPYKAVGHLYACWAAQGTYDIEEELDDSMDLVLELQPSEEQTGGQDDT